MTRRLTAVVATLGGLSALLSLVALLGVTPLSLLARAPVPLGPLAFPAFAAFTALLFVIQQQGFVFHWRGQSTKVSLDEVAIFVGILTIPPAALVLAVAGATLGNQMVHRRDFSKAAFNVGQYTCAAFVVATLCGALAAFGVPSPWSAAVSPPLFYAITALLVSALFAQVEGSTTMRVFTQRFSRFVLIGSAVGVSLGLVVVALFRLHPFAVAAAIPIFVYLRRFGKLSEWADDEIKTHRLVATVSAEVAGRADLDRVGERILSTCHELFNCGEASLVLTRADEPEPRVWRAAFGPSEGYGGVAAEIRGADGARLGTLHVFPQPGQTRYGEREQQLLRTVGAAAAAAAANADALRAARDANAELSASEARYRSLFETAHLLIHVLDENGRIVDANPAALATLQVPLAGAQGRKFDELLVGPVGVTERLRLGQELVGFETQMRTADGGEVNVLVDARSLGGDERRYVVFSRDITTIKMLEGERRRALATQHETIKRLENMNRELEQFTLWTTHDMREPLRSIGTIATFLHEDIGQIPPDEARDLARRISEGADRLKERVKALHAFSLIVQRDEEFEDVDMHRVIEHVVAGLETRIRENGATILLPARFPTIRAQPHRLDQVFGNLVENALKYGRGEGAMVEIGFTETEAEWRFFVRDDGPGIPPGYHERIFQLFQRGPGAQESGSGAGLAIVKRIAEQHGGRAWVESELGDGACFLVALPKPAPAPLVRLSKAF